MSDGRSADEGELRLVATPIGNLGDMTPRAVEALQTAALVLCEDTRHSRPLLKRFDIATPCESLHEHNEASATPRIVSRLKRGEAVALISDAGTPLVSDPGERLVAAAIEAGIRVVPIPGASAIVTALVGAGLGTAPFTFYGFLERKGTERRRQLAELSTLPHRSVVYESPQRLAALLQDLVEVGCGERRAVVARELTKQYEEFRRGTVAELAEYYREAPVRGEIVLVLAGATTNDSVVDQAEVHRAVQEMRSRGLGSREVARELVERFKLGRNEAYRLSLERT